MVRFALASLVVAGCGFRHGAAPDDSVAQIPKDAPADGVPADAPRDCLPAWQAHTVALGTVAKLGELSSGQTERDPFVTADELQIFWSGDPNNTGRVHIFSATRSDRHAPFSNITARTDLSSANNDGKLSITRDGSDAFVASNRAGGQGGFDVWELQAGTGGVFGTASQQALGSVDDDNDQDDASISPDGLRLYYSDNGSGAQAIVVASRSTVGTFGSPTTLIDSGVGDADPTLSRDELVIVFSSNRTGGMGSSDIWYATRASVGATFGAAMPVPTVNTSSADGDPMLSEDACTLYFASSRAGHYDLYDAPVQ